MQTLVLNLPSTLAPSKTGLLASLVEALTGQQVTAWEEVNLGDDAVMLLPLTNNGRLQLPAADADRLASLAHKVLRSNVEVLGTDPLIAIAAQKLQQSGLIPKTAAVEMIRLPTTDRVIYTLTTEEGLREPDGPESMRALILNDVATLRKQGYFGVTTFPGDYDGDRIIEEIAQAFNLKMQPTGEVGWLAGGSARHLGWTAPFFLQDALLQIRSGQLPRVLLGGPWQTSTETPPALLERAQRSYERLGNPVLTQYGQLTLQPDRSFLVAVTEINDVHQLLNDLSGRLNPTGRSVETKLRPLGTELVVTPFENESVFEIIWPNNPVWSTKGPQRMELFTVPREQTAQLQQQWLNGDLLSPWSRAQVSHGRPVSRYAVV